MRQTNSKVAAFLTRQINKSAKSQTEIAQEAGYDKPNIISMLRAGVTKLPLDRVPRMAKALGADPAALMRICLEEYMPEEYSLFKELGVFNGLTENEMKIVRKIRQISHEGDPKLTRDNEPLLRKFVEAAETITT